MWVTVHRSSSCGIVCMYTSGGSRASIVLQQLQLTCPWAKRKQWLAMVRLWEERGRWGGMKCVFRFPFGKTGWWNVLWLICCSCRVCDHRDLRGTRSVQAAGPHTCCGHSSFFSSTLPLQLYSSNGYLYKWILVQKELQIVFFSQINEEFGLIAKKYARFWL